MKTPKHMIWTDDIYYMDEDAWLEDLREYNPDASDDELWRMMWEDNAELLECERMNLDINVPEGIIAIADLGLWNGRRKGYKEVGYNINECLYGNVRGQSDCTWYVDERGDLACEESHHDGRNYYIYRAWKPGVTYDQQDALLNKLYYGTATRHDITRYTRRLGDDIAEVYGWSIRGHKYGYKARVGVPVAVGA